MQKILIIYHSGAGSTKTIAEIYDKLLDKYETDILPVNPSFDYTLLDKYDLLILGFPCYHCEASSLMNEFINKMPVLPQKKKAFTFVTYGLYAGNTLRGFIKKCRSKNIFIQDYADYRSPATDGSLLLPAFKLMYTYEKKIATNILKDIRKVKDILSTVNFNYKLPHFKLSNREELLNNYFETIFG